MRAVKYVQAAHLLLEYCMSDMDISKPESVYQLIGLQLVPTMSGSLTSLHMSQAPRARPMFLATRQQQEVFVSARDVLVSCEVSLGAKITAMALEPCMSHSLNSKAPIPRHHGFQTKQSMPCGLSKFAGLAATLETINTHGHGACCWAIVRAQTGGFKPYRCFFAQEDTPLYIKLKAVAGTGALTLSPVTAAALSGAFLPGLLPSAWAGQAKIRRASCSHCSSSSDGLEPWHICYHSCTAKRSADSQSMLQHDQRNAHSLHRVKPGGHTHTIKQLPLLIQLAAWQ